MCVGLQGGWKPLTWWSLVPRATLGQWCWTSWCERFWLWTWPAVSSVVWTHWTSPSLFQRAALREVAVPGMVWVCHSVRVPVWRLEGRLPLMGWGGAWLCRDLTGQGCSPEVSSELSGCCDLPGAACLGSSHCRHLPPPSVSGRPVLLQPWGFAASVKETEPTVCRFLDGRTQSLGAWGVGSRAAVRVVGMERVGLQPPSAPLHHPEQPPFHLFWISWFLVTGLLTELGSLEDVGPACQLPWPKCTGTSALAFFSDLMLGFIFFLLLFPFGWLLHVIFLLHFVHLFMCSRSYFVSIQAGQIDWLPGFAPLPSVFLSSLGLRPRLWSRPRSKLRLGQGGRGCRMILRPLPRHPPTPCPLLHVLTHTPHTHIQTQRHTPTPHKQTHMQTRPWEHEPSPHQCPLLVPNHLGEPCPSAGHIPFLECLFGFSSTL